MASDRVPVPLLMRMAAHPLRWALMTELAASDRRVRELVAAVGEPQNLVSYHLRLLRSAGLVTMRRSTFDGRDSYYHLDLTRCGTAFAEAAAALHPGLAPTAATSPDPVGGAVLFLCTGNSARSPMAEALLRRRSGGRVEVASAGSHPKPALHPNTVRVMRERYDIDLSAHRTTALPEVAGRRFDYVITLCDKVRELPRDHGPATTVHWSLPDPAAAAPDDEASYPEFCRVAEEIDVRSRDLLSLLTSTTLTRSADHVEHRN
ncbi:arsenate reductase/protein-tyrosine-phosphatase family protein [Nocardia pneumoniae]|uniref:arsenate reductase/protein-tyrosine-phosphatase family protein n=1 Tax=Nocardia pneumoniae TaxID=228601 RepID=UPI000594765D|nr:ArsR family transcriptional regulator [Nocardia pneumoniae]